MWSTMSEVLFKNAECMCGCVVEVCRLLLVIVLCCRSEPADAD